MLMLKNGIILLRLVRFDTAAGKNEVISGGIYHFDNKPLIVKACDADMEFTRAEWYTVLIWVKFMDWNSNIGVLKGSTR